MVGTNVVEVIRVDALPVPGEAPVTERGRPQREDSAICREILDEVLPQVDGIGPESLTVGVYDGVVTLLGRLPSPAVTAVLVARVQRIDGVAEVVDGLDDVVTDLA